MTKAACKYIMIVRYGRHDYRLLITQYKEDYISTGKWIATLYLMIPGMYHYFLVWVFGSKNSQEPIS